MIEDLWDNLVHHVEITIFFLILWPVAVAVLTRLWGQSKDGSRFSLCEACYYSLAMYAGIDAPESEPKRFKWPKLIHRLVGVLAWAYVTAIFIATIT